ncbi:uncharacterized protein LOC9658620 [Selaginella moellendorffii]|uniref:uncharacterized protein LOC9658620 n=1 Tax=Selaginella moellendorffii TaxID=88036 RepID=UPI000D1D0640|nr:uncharacterized protein LOC9658620 [Selaginella moellendorffii]|eukprot:XP_024529379.1 uncharacterized protein LOC9658620 [Selaginella moellendorffii]
MIHQEVEVERDVFAGEVGNLQKLVRRLNATHNRISCQNKELGRLKEKANILETTQHRLQSSMQAAQDTLERASYELKGFRNKARETTLEASRNMKRCKELQQHAGFLEQLLEKERVDKEYFEKKVFQLAQELRRVDTQLQNAKGYSRVNAFKGMPKKKPPEPPPSVKSTTTTTTTSSGANTPKKVRVASPRGGASPRSPRGNVVPDQDVVDITNRLVNAAQFHFEQSFKHKGE